MRFAGKVAVVTGGAQGIGRAIALGLAREGARLVVADMQKDKALAVVEEIQALGAAGLAQKTDVSDEASVNVLKERTLTRFGHVHILINDAGIYPRSPLTEMSEEEWDRVIDVNLGGNFLCARAFLPAMRRQKGGRIVGIASSIAHYGARNGAHYAASKAGIVGFVKALAREVGSDGITVNAICPGIADTALPRLHRDETELLQRLSANPLGHMLRAEDIVGPVLFLSSDAASYITGQTINVNCGSYMR